MTYLNSAKGIKIDMVRAMKEVEDHGIPLSDFFTAFGRNDQMIDAGELLVWLGY